MAVLPEAQIRARLAGLPGWDLTPDGIRKTYSFPSFRKAIAFVNAVADIAEARQHHPDIALVDGLEPAEALHREFPEVAVLVLSMHSDGRYAARAMEAGARGYLLKQTVEQDLAPALERVRAGKQFLSPGVRTHSRSTV